MNMSKFGKNRSPIFPNNGLQFCSIYASSKCSWSWFVHLCFEGMSRFVVASRVYLVTWLCLDWNNSGWWGSAGSWGGRKASKLKSAGEYCSLFQKFILAGAMSKKGVTTSHKNVQVCGRWWHPPKIQFNYQASEMESSPIWLMRSSCYRNFPLHHPIGSMEKRYIYTYMWLKLYGFHVGKNITLFPWISVICRNIL